ncbi:notum pectinacetylesterase 1a [Plakobranchus ocellatus]|uniref:Notum pectinacetylesterase 1a n=1 Tax=Plakobranchus ocellatus TaxID=259542 RepID=A0AAV3Y491_9GAST|nr:notum pectinacetylesterase 1a [Plakobranchus ocellatus]
MPDFMSSRNWPRYRSGSGILSWDPQENPYYFHANVVYIPYCSSDSWTGTRNRTSGGKHSFLQKDNDEGEQSVGNDDDVDNEMEESSESSEYEGENDDRSGHVGNESQKIPKEDQKKKRKQSKEDLTYVLPSRRTLLHYLEDSSVLSLNAGATGVLINIDRIAALIHARKPAVDVRALVDSGWFLDMEPFKEKPCRDAFTCSPMAGIQRGVKVWNPRLPKKCRDAHPTEIWRCFFGRRVYPAIKTPVYIIQNLYDAAQIQVSNVLEEQHTWPRGDLGPDQWRYLLDLGQQVKNTLRNVTAVFAPGCVSHEILNKPEWHDVRIEGTTLAESIYCWETRNNGLSSCQQPNMNSMLSTSGNTPLADSPPSSRKKRKRGRKRRKKKSNKRRKNRDKKRRTSNTRRLSRAASKKCRSHLIDLCPWPHCNCSCPKCRWETLNKVSRYFLRSLAAVMGIDPEKMNNVNLCGY